MRIALLILGIALVIPPKAEAKPLRRTNNARRTFISGELLIKFKDTSSRASRSRVMADRNHVAMKSLDENSLLQHVKLSPGEKVADAMAKYQDEMGSTVESVQPNFIYYASTKPNDPIYGQYWGLNNSGQTITAITGAPDAPDGSTANPGTSGMDIGMEAAWNYITDCSSVTVAVIDTGINYTQDDLAANMWNGGTAYPHHGYNFVDGNNDPIDKNGHGTHVSGTIGAVGNNGIGGTGICWNVQLMAVRVLDAGGSGTTANIVQGVNFAVTNGAKVINMSLGGGQADPAFQTAITNAGNKGVVVVVAAGNDGTSNDSTPTYPCNYNQSNMLCVAALDQKFNMASFSNYGSKSVDVGAPGTNIVSTWSGSLVTTAVDLTTNGNWTLAGANGWGFESLKLTTGATNFISLPANFNFSTVTYKPSVAATAFKTFALTGAVTMDLQAFYETATNTDVATIACNPTGANPFPNSNANYLLDQLTGNGGTSSNYAEYDLTNCLGTNASLGFNFTSGPTINKNDLGVGIFDMNINVLTINPNSYNIIEGTSMATPHVAGLAALVMAQNPNYSVADVIGAIKGGGTAVNSLSGKTKTGKAINALGAIAYINAPTGVAVSK